MAASDLTEETTYTLALQKELAEIDELARWLEPREVVVRATLDEVLAVKFRQMLIGIYGTSIDEDPHAFGKSGQMAISSFIVAFVINPEGSQDPVPEGVAGQVTARGPSIAVVDAAIRNKIEDNTLGNFIILGMSELIGGDPITVVEPKGAVARQWIFTVFKEVER